MPDAEETTDAPAEEQEAASATTDAEAPEDSAEEAVEPKVDAAAISLPQLGIEDRSTVQERLGAMMDVGVQVTAVVGQREISLEQLLAVKIGTVIDLERLAGEPIELQVNGKPIARAEVVVADGRLSARVLERIVPSGQDEVPSDAEPVEPATPPGE